MNKECLQKNNWGDNFDFLTDYQFDELIDHAEKCQYHSEILTDYENSMLPILRAALPEKNITYYAKPKKTNVLSFTVDCLFVYISTLISDTVVKIYNLNANTKKSFKKSHYKLKYYRLNVVTLILAMSIFALAFSVWFAPRNRRENAHYTLNSDLVNLDGQIPKIVPSPDLFEIEPTPDLSKERSARIKHNHHSTSHSSVSVQVEKISVQEDRKPENNKEKINDNVEKNNALSNNQISNDLNTNSETDLTKNQKIIASEVTDKKNGLINFEVLLSNLTTDQLQNTKCKMISNQFPDDSKVSLTSSGKCNWKLKANQKYVLEVENPEFELYKTNVTTSDILSQELVISMNSKTIKE